MTRKSSSAALRKLHSVHVLLQDREFRGQIEVGASKYDLAFKPTSVAVNGGKLEITGTISARRKGAASRTVSGVRATLAASQGGIGAMPPAPAKYASRILGPPHNPALPRTETTDATGYVGALYFHLSPIDRRALGIPLDLTRVQMNLRLAPVSQTERELQWLFSALTGALLGSAPDETLAREYAGEIQTLLTA